MPSDARGLVDVSALEKLVDEDVAGLMLTNPNTLGLFEQEIQEIARIVHGVGGLVYYDGANLNAILGRCRPGDMGFDIVHINTHKTFATPHGGGGPGAGSRRGRRGAGAATSRRRIVERDDATGSFRWDADRPTLDRPPPRLHGNFGGPGPRIRVRVPARRRRPEGGERARGAERQLPGVARSRTTSRSRSRAGARCTSSSRRRRR